MKDNRMKDNRGTGTRYHKTGCGCCICDKSKAGARNHKSGCQCAFCGPGPGMKDHGSSCTCAFHSGGSRLQYHKSDCICPFCSPLAKGEAPKHKKKCKCSFCNKLGGTGVQDHKPNCQCTVCFDGSKWGWTNTSLEIRMQEMLTELGVEFETQKRFGRYQVDIFVPSRNLVIECDGEPWHKDKAKERKRDRFLRTQGLSVWHFTGKLIKANPRPKLLRALRYGKW